MLRIIAPKSMILSPGSRLGPYEILAPLGAGGMGEVYRARDPRLGREVAIKVLPTSFTSDPDRLRRFEQEARAAGMLSHPNLTAVFDVGKSEDGAPYVVQELLEGETLRSALSGGPLSPKKSVDYALQIAHGLAAAHEKGIVHRDLKPENVFVTGDGRVKILDFGLAKLTEPDEKAGALSGLVTTAAGTQTGVVLGTLVYMSPEQLKGQLADSRSDLFALGAVLYEMLTGRRPFEGATPAETITAILNEDPPEIPGSGARISPALDRVVRHCLEKSPASRFQSARDLAFALESSSTSRVESDPAGSAGAAIGGGRDRRSRAPERVAFALAGAVLAGAAVLLLLPGRGRIAPPSQTVRFTIPPPKDATIYGMLALSPDGRRIAFVATTADGRDLLFVRPLDALEARAIDGTEGAAFPFWSPDSRNVAFFAQDKLKRVDSAGGPPQTLCDAAAPRGGSWGRGGTIVFSVHDGGEMHRVAEGGGIPAALPGLSGKGLDASFRWPSFLPDGRHFVYFGTADGFAVFLGSLDPEKPTRLVAADAGVVYAAPGYLLYRSGDRLMAHRFDTDRLRLSGEPFPVLEHVWWDLIATGAIAVSVSENGLLACQTGGPVISRLLWYDRSGHELGALGPDGAYWEPTFSPDDRWLVASRMDPEKLHGDLWMFDLEHGGLSRITSEDSVPATVLWSPDGRRIAYSGFVTGGVFGRDARGAEKEKVLFREPSFTPLDDWSRDGRLLFYQVWDLRKFHADVWVRDLQTGTSRPVLQAAFTQQGSCLSPDGRWLAYESEETGAYEVFVRSFPGDGERRQISKGGGQQPRWRGDGKELFYVSPDRKIVSVEIRPGPSLETGEPRPLFQTRIRPQIEARNHYDATSDGQRFIVNSRRLEEASLPITVVVNWRSEAQK
jgi:Tol biopolymer transport system component